MIPFGLSYLEDNAKYDVRGGLGNKVLMNIKLKMELCILSDQKKQNGKLPQCT